MSASPVQIWLSEGREYFEGLELCRRYVRNDGLMKLLQTGETSFTRKKMLAALTDVDVEAMTDSQRVDPIQRKLNMPEYNLYDLPESLHEKHKLKGQLYRDAGKLHQQLWYLAGKELEDAAGAIVTMMRANQQLWEEIEYYNQYGELPKKDMKISVPEVETMREVEIPIAIQRISEKISKKRKKLLTTVNDADRKRMIQELSILEATLAKLKLKRNELLNYE